MCILNIYIYLPGMGHVVLKFEVISVLLTEGTGSSGSPKRASEVFDQCINLVIVL